MKNNPYVGPCPFERSDSARFFGRARETRDLLSLIMAERVVLFYAQSGAGKTSLLNTKIMPALEDEGFFVLPVVRVGSALPPELASAAVKNIFVFSVWMGLMGQATPLTTLTGNTLLTAIKGQWAAAPLDELGSPRPPILIIDQFEEIFTTHRDRWQEAKGFFEQLADALEKIPQLGVVLAMREDYVAGLDPYAPLLPKRLKARYRMARLGYDSALEAVQQPAHDAGCPFEPDVAEALVHDLQRIKASTFEAQGQTTIGPDVEPVQLQVVCNQLWYNLPTDKHSITSGDVQEYGNIDRALIDFYEGAVKQAGQQTPAKERDVRHWFARQLITPLRTRGLALRGEKDTAGLPNETVDLLERRHLIASDTRAGGRWYELSHDRLIDPILESNAAWEAARQTPLRATAKQWAASHQRGLLFIGAPLRAARQWVKEHPDEAEDYEVEFVQASLWWQRLLLGTAALTLLIVTIVSVLGYTAYRASRTANSRAIAAIAERRLSENREQAILLAREALKQGYTAEAEIAARKAILDYEPAESLPGVTDSVYSVAYSPDGQRLLAGLSGHGVRLWDLQTHQITAVWPIKGEVWGVAYRPDGRQAAITKGNNVLIWDVRGTPLITLTGPAGVVFSVAYSPDGRWLAAGAGDANAYIWDTTTWQPISLTNHVRSVRSVAFSPNGQYLATGSWDKTILLWPISTTASFTLSIGQPLTLTGHTSAVESVAFSPDSRWLASGSDDRTVRIWDVSTGKEALTLTGQSDSVRAVAFSPDGQWLLSGGADSVVVLYAFGRRDINPMARLTGATSLINGATFSPDSRYVAAGSGDGSIWVWDRLSPLNASYRPLQGHTAMIYDLAYSPDGRYLASGAEKSDGTVRLWDTQTGESIVLPKANGSAAGLAFSPDGRTLAAGYGDGLTRLWDLSTNPITVTRILTGHQADYLVNSVKFSPDGRYLATGSADGTAIIWDAQNGQLLQRLKGHTGSVNSVAFSPDGQQLATGSDDTTIGLWDVASGALIRNLTGHDGAVRSVAFNPAGKTLASGSWDATARIWDLKTFTTTETLIGHTGYIYDLAFSPDGKRLLTGSRDTSVRLWDLTLSPPQVVGILVGHTGPVRAVAYSPIGSEFASGSLDTTIRRYPARFEDVVQLAAQLVTRDLTPQEEQSLLGQ